MAQNVEEHILKLKDLFSGGLARAGKNTDAFRGKVSNVDRQMRQLKRVASTVFTGFVAKQVIGDIIKVGSNFEQLQISFETMLGSAEKAKELIKDITVFAEKTPFELQDVSKGAKSLLAFGIAQERILPTLRNLGDVAAGVSVPIERIILNFGQVKAATRITGREIRDFTTAGIPILNELAKVTGKPVSQIQKLASEGKIGFAAVEAAFANMAGEGGKFFNLMEKQTASTGGQVSNFRDVLALLENDLFTRLKPTIDSIVQGLGQLVEIARNNIDTIIEMFKVLGKLVKIFIAFKIGVVVGTLAMKLWRFGVIAARVVLAGLRSGMAGVVAQMNALKIAFATNPIGLIVGLVAVLAASFIDLTPAIFESTQEMTRFGNAIDEVSKKIGKKLFEKLAIGGQAGVVTGAGGIDQVISSLEKSELQSLELFLSDIIPQLRRKVESGVAGKDFAQQFGDTLAGVPITRFFQQGLTTAQKTDPAVQLGVMIQSLQVVEKELKRFNREPEGPKRVGLISGKKGGKLSAGLATVRSGAPKIFNINIEKQIEQLIFKTEKPTEAPIIMKEQLRKALAEVLNDVQLIGK